MSHLRRIIIKDITGLDDNRVNGSNVPCCYQAILRCQLSIKDRGKAMKKFILVDNQGNTYDQQHIEAGKFRTGDGDAMDASVAAIMKSGTNSPILAVMNYPGVIDSGLKMFLLHVWKLEGDGYSVVKEVPVLAITADHKLVFAIKAVGAIYDFSAYRDWAEKWLSGGGRSFDSLQDICKKVDEEIRQLEEEQALACIYGQVVNSHEAGLKKAQFERAKLVFHAAELVLNSEVDKVFDQEIGQVFHGIEEFVDAEKLTSISDEVIKVA